MKKKAKLDYEAQLLWGYANWDYLCEYGGRDPYHDDSINMNLTRNHIISWKREMEELYGADLEKYPEVYFRELPPEVKPGYMAGAGRIRDKAAEALELYLADADFQYLLYHRDMLDEKEAKNISIDNVLGYVSGLAAALKNEDLVTMRRHAIGSERYLASFAGCAEKVTQILEEKKKESLEQDSQITLFQMGLEAGRCR